MTGSSLPSRARSVRSLPYFSRDSPPSAGVSLVTLRPPRVVADRLLHVGRATLLDRGEVPGLGEGEQQQVEGEEGVTLGLHQGVGALEHVGCLTPEGRAVGGAGLVRERADAGVGLSQDVAGAGARSLEEQIGLGVSSWIRALVMGQA